MRELSPETQAQHELAVIEALAKLGRGKINQIVRVTNLESNAVRWALQRQEGISVEKVAHGKWAFLPEPGDQELQPLTESEQKDLAFEGWLIAQGIKHEGFCIKNRGRHRYYYQRLRFDQVEPGHVITVGTSRFLRVHRIEHIDGRIRFWEKNGKTPARSGNPSDQLIVRITPDVSLYWP